ncbi:DNA-binding response regulator [Helicobacter didelphidarum]|uniref:DNA-binding response regulator n=2 Tax=Helicobacter didelphidarum TaxID=2040648 RepID=A0A3D8ILN3_9HELI|nr:DNA-binding response regulator [Helicobacter didelphidarum]
MTILFVEDERESREILSGILMDYAGEVIVKNNGVDALRAFSQVKIDLIVSDILMPKMDGIAFARAIRSGENDPSVPIILTTAFTDTQYLLDSIQLKVDGYVLKPIDFDDLLETIQKALLPRMQTQELQLKNRLLRTLSAFYGGKKIELIQYLIEHCNSECIFYGSHDDIAKKLNMSRQTIAKAFQELVDFGLLTKVRNKTYRLNEYK